MAGLRSIPVFGGTLMITLALAGCDSVAPALPLGTDGQPIEQSRAPAPPGAPEGTCWGKTVTPAVIETVTDSVLVEPAILNAEGNVVTPPQYRTETHQQIVTPRKDRWFETPCADALTPEFIASLQRALQARGLYRGTVDGEMNFRTRRAVRALQEKSGVKSETLSLRTARQLGLIAVPRSATD